jgi:zinc protease
MSGAMLIARAVLLLAFLIPSVAVAQVDGVTRTRLPNGLTLLVRENPIAPVVAFSVMVKMGTRTETPATAGISNLLQLMMVRGTDKLAGEQIVEAADRMGGSIDAYGDADYSEITATALSRSWQEMLELVADIALRPSLPDGTFGPVRDFLARQIRNRGDKPYDVAMDRMREALYGSHPYAWDPTGRRESLERLTRGALVAYYRAHYVPEGMVVAMSGQVKTAEVQAQVARLFGGMPAGKAPVPSPPAPPPMAATRQVFTVAGAQAQIVMSGLAPSLTDKDYAPTKVLASLLGGGMAGRYFSELRDKQALAYTTFAQYATRVDTSAFVNLLGTGPENVAKAEAALKDELARVQNEPVSAQELSIAKAYLLGSQAMDRRTNQRQAWYLAFYEVAGVGQEFLDRYAGEVKKVTAADLQRVARRYLGTVRTVIVEPPK